MRDAWIYEIYIQSLSYNEFIIFHNINDSDEALLQRCRGMF